MYFGADYYPEHVSETRWETDARLMQAAGFNVVRLAEFAWSLLEPEPDVFDFSWLDRAIAILAAYGMQIVLGTPTATPPRWLFTEDMALVNEQGQTFMLGSRREYSPNSPEYRRLSVRVVQHMVDHYHNNPHIIGWQIDNEFGDRCYSPASRNAFEAWLKQRYKTLECLNERWGTRFWSQNFSDWSQVYTPTKNIHAIHHPGLLLDYDRFMSDSYRDFQQAQVDVIRERCPQHFITHNFMGFGYDKINYFDLAQTLDLVSWDNYPRGFWITTPEIDSASLALSHATMYGLKQQSFWVMEQQSGHGAWNVIPPSARPGEIRLWVYQGIAHGASGIVFFRWQTAHYGAEQFWQGILDHDGVPQRRYMEVQQIGHELQRIGTQIAESEVKSETALLLSYDSRFAFQIQPTNPDFSYPHHLASYYRALHRQNISAAVVSPESDFSPYKLLIVPSLFITEKETVAQLQAFAEGGGVLIITMRSGVKLIDNQVIDKPLPGLLQELCGVTIHDYDSLLSGQTRTLQFQTPHLHGNASVWCDMLTLTHAEPLASYGEDYYVDEPAVSLNKIGNGYVFYVGTCGDDDLVNSIVDYAIELSHVSRGLATPQGVEAVVRWRGREKLLFLLNHTSEVQEVTLEHPMRDALSSEIVVSIVSLPPKAVRIFEESR